MKDGETMAAGVRVLNRMNVVRCIAFKLKSSETVHRGKAGQGRIARGSYCLIVTMATWIYGMSSVCWDPRQKALSSPSFTNKYLLKKNGICVNMCQ